MDDATLGGATTVTVFPPGDATVQVNDVVPTVPKPSVNVTVTGAFHTAAVGVPEIKPDDDPMVSPAGSPVAAQVSV